MLAFVILTYVINYDDAHFETFNLPPQSYLNNVGGASSGFFNSGNSLFNNSYDSSFNFWSGFAISNVVDTTTPGFLNQYASIAGSGAAGSQHYAVALTFGIDADPFVPGSSFVNLAPGTSLQSVDITNTTYAYLAMRDGTSFSDPFTTADQDYFRLTIRGYSALDGVGPELGAIDFYLADFRTGPGFILDTWQTVDLSLLSNAASLRFFLSSTDNNAFGLLTPAYFALDNLRFSPVPEPATNGLIIIALCFVWMIRRFRNRIDCGLSGATGIIQERGGSRRADVSFAGKDSAETPYSVSAAERWNLL